MRQEVPGCHDGSPSSLCTRLTPARTSRPSIKGFNKTETCARNRPHPWCEASVPHHLPRSDPGRTGQGGHATQGRTRANKPPRHKRMFATNRKEILKEQDAGNCSEGRKFPLESQHTLLSSWRPGPRTRTQAGNAELTRRSSAVPPSWTDEAEPQVSRGDKSSPHTALQE